MAGNKKTKVPKIKRRHGFYVMVMVVGWLLPPLAVAMRFGIGRDFFINVFFTVCGYIPGHVHNFYLQNIRDNSSKARTPAWAVRAGLVQDKSAKRKKQQAWANRYDERTATRGEYEDEDRHGVDSGIGRSNSGLGSANGGGGGRPRSGSRHSSLLPGEDDASSIHSFHRGTDAPSSYPTGGLGDLPGAGDRRVKQSKKKLGRKNSAASETYSAPGNGGSARPAGFENQPEVGDDLQHNF